MDKVQELYDIEAIKQLKAKYCYYVDEWFEDPSNLERLLNEVFTDDTDLDFGIIGTASGRKEVEEFFINIPFKLLSFSQHLVHSPLIEIANESDATGKWHFFVPCTFGEEGEGNVATWISGTYDEKYVKRGGRWFIRAIKVKFFFISPFDQGWVNVPNMLAG